MTCINSASRCGAGRRPIVLGLACLGSCLLIGCAHPPPVPGPPTFSSYRAPDFDYWAVRRVVLLPAETQTRYADEAERFRANLASELRATGLFEVVELPPYAFECPSTAVLHGTFPEHLLVDLARRFQADALLFTNVTQYQPYAPPRIGAKVHLVSTKQAITLATVDGVWDARDESLACEARAFYAQISSAHSVPRCELVLQSPDLFQKFVARKIAGALAGRPVFEPELCAAGCAHEAFP